MTCLGSQSTWLGAHKSCTLSFLVENSSDVKTSQTGDEDIEVRRKAGLHSNFELVFVSRNPPDSTKKSVTEILLRGSSYGDAVTETPTLLWKY